MNIRNVAIIAHVDHGKTTLVDFLLKQSHTFRDNEAAMSQDLIMDSNDQERERGITILAKNTSVMYKDTKINIIDTPGHADFGGEVERTLNMADGALLIVDAQEGPMPQTKFVLKKALDLGLKLIVVINKIDKVNARPDAVLHLTSDLFLDLASHESHLDFPVLYAIGREGKAWAELPNNPNELADLSCLFDAILEHVPAPKTLTGPLQMLVTALDSDTYQGIYSIGRITRGTANAGQSICVISADGNKTSGRIEKVYVNVGLKRVETMQAEAGDIIALTGVKDAKIGDTIADASTPEALPTIEIEEPTLKMAFSANTSPFAGREGKFVTSRQILERIERELKTNVSMKLGLGTESEFLVSGRGELHLSVFIEQLRREGFELQVSKPYIIEKDIDGVKCEPIEELTVDVVNQYVGATTAEVSRRKGILQVQDEQGSSTRLVFHISTRGLLGLRNQLLTLSRGTAVLNSLFLRYEPIGAPIPRMRNGVLMASQSGKAVIFGLDNAQERGITFIPPQTEVYEGMIVGLHSREQDIEINVCKEKQLTNIRSSNADFATILTPPTILSLEQSIDFLEDDELLEVTPKTLRLRKKLLNATERSRSRK